MVFNVFSLLGNLKLIECVIIQHKTSQMSWHQCYFVIRHELCKLYLQLEKISLIKILHVLLLCCLFEILFSYWHQILSAYFKIFKKIKSSWIGSAMNEFYGNVKHANFILKYTEAAQISFLGLAMSWHTLQISIRFFMPFFSEDCWDFIRSSQLVRRHHSHAILMFVSKTMPNYAVTQQSLFVQPCKGLEFYLTPTPQG